jgi:outer membrane protein assembly factor BamB
MRIRYNEGSGCTPPDPGQPGLAADGLISLGPAGAPGEPRLYEHGGLSFQSYCYTFWVIHSGSVASPGVSAVGRPFDATGSLKWKYATSTATTGVAPPTVGIESVIAIDNSGDVHGMLRSAGGGTWPTTPAWNPLDLASPSQARNPIIPGASGSRAYISTQDGRVHSVDPVSGALHWSRQLSPASVQGAPAAILAAFGGEHDAIFAGTSAADDNVFHALDPVSGAPVAAFGFPSNPGIGAILGMAVVDYASTPRRVYFASLPGSAAETLWCLELGPPGPVSFSLRWKVDVGAISGSPVLRGGRIYVGTDAGEVKSVRAADGGDVRTAALGDGPVRGFVFPDRASADLYASTSNKVWRLSDPGTGTALNVLWAGGVSVPSPSPPVMRPGATHLYVGGSDGVLYELALPSGSVKPLALDYDPISFTVGAPSFDSGFDLVVVGSVRGVFYGVQVPLP